MKTSLASEPVTFSLVLKYLGLGIIAVLFSTYVVFQARYIIRGPQLTLIDEPGGIQNERQITLSGHAENITDIRLNGRQIVTNEDGYFAEHIVLENGYNVVQLQAHDRYGRKTVIEREFVFTPLSYLE